MNERRRDKRVGVELPATIKVGKKPLAASTINVSFHGLSVKLGETPPLRQLVQLDIDLPGGKPFTAHAMVVHAKEGFIGLEFFGRSSHPEWDEFVQTSLRTAPLTNPNALAAPVTNPSAIAAPLTNPAAIAAPTTNPKIAAPTLPTGSPPPGARAPSVPPPMPAMPPMPSHPTPPPYTGPERRRAPRIHMKLELRLRTQRSIHTAHTVDVSMIGATLIVADLQAQIGEPVILNLIQPGTSFSFRRDGVLKRIDVVEGPWTHVGIEFSALEPTRELLFAEFMNTAYSTLKT